MGKLSKTTPSELSLILYMCVCPLGYLFSLPFFDGKFPYVLYSANNLENSLLIKKKYIYIYIYIYIKSL